MNREELALKFLSILLGNPNLQCNKPNDIVDFSFHIADAFNEEIRKFDAKQTKKYNEMIDKLKGLNNAENPTNPT